MSSSTYGTFGEPATSLVKRARRHERLMPKSLQVANIMKVLSNRNINAFQADVEDLVDPTLHYEENKKEILHHYQVAEKDSRVHEQVKEQCPVAISECKEEKVETACEFACEVCKDKKSCVELKEIEKPLSGFDKVSKAIKTDSSITDDYGFKWNPVKTPKSGYYRFTTITTEVDGETINFNIRKYGGWQNDRVKLAEDRERKKKGEKEVAAPKPPSEFVTIVGHKKHRMRCPKCGRAAPDNFCIVHSDVEAVDVTKDKRVMEMTLENIKAKEKHDAKKGTAATVRQIIRDLEKEYGWNVPISEVIDLAEYEGLKREDAEEAILWMKRDGILFSPGKDEISISILEKRIPEIPPEAFGLKAKKVPSLPTPLKKVKKIKYFEKQLTTKQIQAIKKLGHIDININKVKKRITKKHLVPKKRIQKIKWYPCGKKVCLKKDKIQNSLDGKGKVVKKIARESGASKSYSYQVLKEAKKKGKAKLVDKKPLKYSRRKKRENKK